MNPKFNRVVVAGAGGVGFYATALLCHELGGLYPVEVYDADAFEGGNGHIRLPKVLDPTMYKVDLLSLHVAFVMGDRPPIVHRKFLTPEDFSKGNWSKTLVLDCTDMDQEPREKFWKALKNSGATGIRISYDGLGIQTISPGPPMWTGDDTSGHYNIIPNRAQSFGAAGLGAQAALYTFYTGKKLDFQVHVPTPETESIEIPIEGDSNAHLYSDSGRMSSSSAV